MADTKPVAVQTRIAERLHEFKREFAPKVAALRRPVLGNVPVSKDERRRRWWQTADDWPADPEESRIRELQLRGYAPDGTPLLDDAGLPVKGLSREDVGLLKHPYREIDARAFGGSDDDRKIAKYAQEMSELGPPPPEPLEAAALAARQETAPEPASSAAPTPSLPAEMASPVPAEGGY